MRESQHFVGDHDDEAACLVDETIGYMKNGDFYGLHYNVDSHNHFFAPNFNSVSEKVAKVLNYLK